MRTVTKIPTKDVQPLRRTAEGDADLSMFLKTEVEQYLSGLAQLHTRYETYIRMYRGIPATSFSNDPIPIRNIEVTVGAIAVDTLAAQASDMLNSAQPLVTVRGNKGFEKHADAMQRLVNHLAIDPFTNFDNARKDYLNDVIELGTGVLYTTWQEDHKYTGVEEIVDWGPRVMSPAPEDMVFPPAAGPDVQTLRLIGFNNPMSGGELKCRAAVAGWDTQKVKPTRNTNPVRKVRQVVAHVSDKDAAEVDNYDLYELFILYPYSDSKYDLDLYCVWDRTSASILYLDYNPFDVRPFSVGRYQFQPHSFTGLGVMEMIGPYEIEITDWHNFRMANAKLVGSRAWGVKSGSPMSGMKLRIIPNKPLYFNDTNDLKEFRMADVYPSILQYEQASMQMADKRVGTMTDFSAKPMPGHRTPGITALSMLQQINKRFTTAFDEIRCGEADCLEQCILRMQEKYKAGGEARGQIMESVTTLLGDTDAQLIFEIFRGTTQQLQDKMTTEMTASSQSINREADKQSALQVLNVLGGYYDKISQLAMAAVNPQTPPPLKELLVKIATNSSLAMDKFLKAFDQVRDTHLFLLDEDDFNALVAQQGQGGVGLLSGGPQGGEANVAGEGDGGEQGMGGDMSGAGGAPSDNEPSQA